ncbi:hypothetical protein D046_7465A, partial [Vibrio parahaemolyticus V-223/04]
MCHTRANIPNSSIGALMSSPQKPQYS